MTGEHSPTTSARQAVVALQAALTETERERDAFSEMLVAYQKDWEAAEARAEAAKALLAECEAVLKPLAEAAKAYAYYGDEDLLAVAQDAVDYAYGKKVVTVGDLRRAEDALSRLTARKEPGT